MKIIIDGTIFSEKPIGGISRVFCSILPLLCDVKPDLQIIVLSQTDQGNQLLSHKRISYVRPLQVRRSGNFPNKLGLFNIFKNFHHQRSFASKNTIWLSTYFTLPPANWRGKQAVMVHDFIHELFPEHLPGGERVVKQKADAINAADIVICNSWTTCRDLMSRFSIPKNRVFVTHLAANSTFRTKQKEELGIFVDYPFLLYIGKRNGYKNFKTLFDAYTDWPGNSTVKLLLVGPKLSETEINTFQRCSVSEKIVLVENPDDEALCDLYNQALAFVYPSLYEGFGIPLLEAMQCHCPIIASSIPSTLEVAGDVPIYFEATDKISLLNALNQLSNTSDLQARADKGIIHARQYSWEKTAADFFKALQTLDI